MSTIFAKNYYLKAKYILEARANRGDGPPPSIEEIWREAMRIAWPEPEADIELSLAMESDLDEGQVLTEDGPFWIMIDGERYLVVLVGGGNGVLVFKDKVPAYDNVDEWLTKKLGLPEPLVPDYPDDENEPEDPDYTGPKGP